MSPLRLSRYPVNWRKVARDLKQALGYICQECDTQCRLVPSEPGPVCTVAHVYPDSHAPDAEVVCVQILCSRCHLRFDAAHAARRTRLYHRRYHMSLPTSWARLRQNELSADDIAELAAPWLSLDELLGLEDGIDFWAAEVAAE